MRSGDGENDQDDAEDIGDEFESIESQPKKKLKKTVVCTDEEVFIAAPEISDANREKLEEKELRLR